MRPAVAERAALEQPSTIPRWKLFRLNLCSQMVRAASRVSAGNGI